MLQRLPRSHSGLSDKGGHLRRWPLLRAQYFEKEKSSVAGNAIRAAPICSAVNSPVDARDTSWRERPPNSGIGGIEGQLPQSSGALVALLGMFYLDVD